MQLHTKCTGAGGGGHNITSQAGMLLQPSMYSMDYASDVRVDSTTLASHVGDYGAPERCDLSIGSNPSGTLHCHL